MIAIAAGAVAAEAAEAVGRGGGGAPVRAAPRGHDGGAASLASDLGVSRSGSAVTA